MINIQDIFKIQNQHEFEEMTLRVFHFQAEHCEVYRQFIQYLNINPKEINSVEKIPFCLFLSLNNLKF